MIGGANKEIDSVRNYRKRDLRIRRWVNRILCATLRSIKIGHILRE